MKRKKFQNKLNKTRLRLSAKYNDENSSSKKLYDKNDSLGKNTNDIDDILFDVSDDPRVKRNLEK